MRHPEREDATTPVEEPAQHEVARSSSGKRKGRKKTAANARTKKVRTRSARAAERVREGSDDAATVAVKIEDLPLITSRKWYITLSAALGIFGSIVSATYFVIDYGRIKPIEKELQDNRVLLANAKSEALTAKSQRERAEQRSGELAAKFDRPVQIFPHDRSSVVGSNISFLWDYGKHDTNTQYIIELQDMAGHSPAIKINVDRPETKSMFYAFEPAAAGSYAWWVRPGRVVSDEEIGQGPWSPPAVFTIHPSVTERIRATGKLLMASTPTSYDMGVNNRGDYAGFEIKVLRWLAPRLAEKLKLKQPPKLEVEEIPWNRLFNFMQNGEADIAVRSITRSVGREKEYQNLKFTVGYALNHQMFIQSKPDGMFPESLRGSRVGAKSRSVNESVAKFLADRYGYEVNSSYTAYGDILEGLRRGEIAYALVDSSLVNGLLGKGVFALGSYLDDELRDYYKRELGFDHEEYAILVHEGGSSELRTALNEILASDEYRKFASDSKIELPPK